MTRSIMVRCVVFVYFFTLAELALATKNQYFWLIRLAGPAIRASLQGFVRARVPEGATNALPQMQYFPIVPGRSPAGTASGSGIQVQRGWNINNLATPWSGGTGRWAFTPFTIGDGEHPSFLLNSQSTVDGLESALLWFSKIAAFFGVDSKGILNSFSIPEKAMWNADYLGLSGTGFEIPSADASAQLIVSMVPIHTSQTETVPASGTELANALNAAIPSQSKASGQDGDTGNSMMTNLLLTLADQTMPLDSSLYFSPTLGSYFLVSPTLNTVLTLVPHQTILRLGLASGANRMTPYESDPDNWMD